MKSTCICNFPAIVRGAVIAGFIAAGTNMLPGIGFAFAEQPPPPCHSNPHAALERALLLVRDDIRHLPVPLIKALDRLADRPHTFMPMQVFAEADLPSQLFQYYLVEPAEFI